VFLGNFGEWPYGATTAAVLQLFLFHAAGAPFKAPASFYSSLKFSEYQRRAVKKTLRKVVERWLYGALTGTAQLFSSDSTIFSPLKPVSQIQLSPADF
jgi:hypothetical protein